MQTTKQSTFQSAANTMQDAIQQILLNQVNTILPGKIIAVNKDGTYDVQPTLTYLNQGSSPSTSPVIYNIPATVKRFGNAAIKGHYVVGDSVILGIVQRDISILKKAWNKITNPGSYRKFSLPDAIIIDAVSNSQPVTYIELKDGEINIVSEVVNLNVTTANINASTVNIDGSAVNINGDLTINDVPYADHQHTAGEYMDGNNKPVTGTSGGLS